MKTFRSDIEKFHQKIANREDFTFLNPWLKSAGFERHYYMNDNYFSKMTCKWG